MITDKLLVLDKDDLMPTNQKLAFNEIVWSHFKMVPSGEILKAGVVIYIDGGKSKILKNRYANEGIVKK